MHNIVKIDTGGHREARYRPYATIQAWRRVKPSIMINGEEVSRYMAPLITEYVDMETGEIIPAEALKDDPEVWPTIRASERSMQRAFVLECLRKEVREFARFVLTFRNQRRGITPAIEDLVEWYAQLHGKRPGNVRRYVKQLEDTGILAGKAVLAPLFQIAGRSITAKEHSAEDVVASMKFMQMTFKTQSEQCSSLREAA